MIVDSEGLHHRAFDGALVALGRSPVPFADYAEHFSSRGEGLEWASRRDHVAPEELHRLKQTLYAELLRAEARLCPFADVVIPALARRYPLVVATNSPREEALFVLDRFGLGGAFRAVVGRQDYGRPKPAPDAFRAAAAALGAEASECLVVEDAPKGLRAAVAAGARCVVVPNDYTRRGPFDGATAILGSLAELTPERAATLAA